MIDIPKKSLTIAEFTGAFERTVTIEIELDSSEECNVCKKIKPILTMDGSGGEYSVGRICKDCIDEAFSKIKSQYLVQIVSAIKKLIQ